MSSKTRDTTGGAELHTDRQARFSVVAPHLAEKAATAARAVVESKTAVARKPENVEASISLSERMNRRTALADSLIVLRDATEDGIVDVETFTAHCRERRDEADRWATQASGRTKQEIEGTRRGYTTALRVLQRVTSPGTKIQTDRSQ